MKLNSSFLANPCRFRQILSQFHCKPFEQIGYTRKTFWTMTLLFNSLLLLLIFPSALAQTDRGFHLSHWSTGGSGSESMGGEFSVRGNAGQSHADPVMGGGIFQIKGGFLYVITPPPAPSLFLPIIRNQSEPPTPPMWQQIGGAGRQISDLAIHNGQLFAAQGSSNPSDKGLHSLPLENCGAGASLTSAPALENARVFDILFHNGQGIAATLRSGIFYSSDGGITWPPGLPSVDGVYALASGGGLSFAGTEFNGIHQSSDNGRNWSTLPNSPLQINTFWYNAGSNTLWIGTNDQGVWVYTLGGSGFSKRSDGLNSEAETNVWKIVFDGTNYYIGTSNGVFAGNGSDAWVHQGLSNIEVRSLIIVGDQLYAGLKDTEDRTNIGVRRMSLTEPRVWVEENRGENWPNIDNVRELLYDPTYCKGLLAATNDGVWVLR